MAEEGLGEEYLVTVLDEDLDMPDIIANLEELWRRDLNTIHHVGFPVANALKLRASLGLKLLKEYRRIAGV